MSYRKTLFAASVLVALAASPVRSEEYYFRGLGEIFSAGVCFVGSGECYSYMNVHGAIRDACAVSNKSANVKVVGHSFGAAAALKFTWEVTKCGRNVTHVVFMDALTTPYGLPKNTKWRAYQTPGFSGNVNKSANVVSVGDLHAFQTFNTTTLNSAREFLDR